MVPAHMMMINSAFYFLAGFVIGVLVKSVIDGMASREVYEGRLDQLDRQYESIELDVEHHGGRLNRLEARDDGPTPIGQKPSPAEVADAVDMLVARPAPGGGFDKLVALASQQLELQKKAEERATPPPFGDYHRFLSRPVAADTVRI